MSKLTAKQEKFCNEYLIDLNATQAAIRAGYSEKTAKEQGCQNLTKLNISARIAELRKEQEKDKISFEWFVQFLYKKANNCEKDADQIKAVQELGKAMGYYEEHNKQKGPTINMPQFMWADEDEGQEGE